MANDGVVARWVYRKAKWAAIQTGWLGQPRTIINVDEDEALLIAKAVAQFIEDSGETDAEADAARREAAAGGPQYKKPREAECE